MVEIDSNKLKEVNKPARYVGGEVGSIIKNSGIKSSIVLCYPNLYEKGMSSYIYNLIYNNLNSINSVWCKRCFAPDIDFEHVLRNQKEQTYSLEDFKPVKENDFIVFVIEDELDFTNFLNMIELSNISAYKEDRNDLPKICVLCSNNINIKPIIRFADYVFDFENETENIKRLIYYIVNYDSLKHNNSNLTELTKDYEQIKLDHNITSRVIPSIKINNPSIIVNCESKMSIDDTVKYVKKCMELQGITKVSFRNQSDINEYKFCELVYKLKANIENIRILTKNIDFNNLSPEALDIILPCLEQATLEFNIITCSDTLKTKYDIGTASSALFERLNKVFKNNRNSIKLNFTIGFPDETYEDIDNIFSLSEEILNVYSRNKAKDKFSMKISIDYYIPNASQYSVSDINKLDTKVRYIKDKQIDSAIKVDIQDLKVYPVKKILKNGGEEEAEVLYRAFKLGARFDLNINNKDNNAAWEKAIYDEIKEKNYENNCNK